MGGEIRQLAMNKGTHRYVFRYRAGQEADIVAAFASLAGDAEHDFDWFDAAALSYQMGRRLETDLAAADGGG